MNNILIGFRDEVTKEAVDPKIIGLIIGALLGSVASKKVADAIKLLASKAGKATTISGPITGGAMGALLAHLVTRGGDKTSKVFAQPPPQEPLRRLTVEGVPNIYGQPGYNPRF